MNNVDTLIEGLRHLGGSERLRDSLTTLAEGERPGRVIEQHRSGVVVDDGLGVTTLRPHPSLQRTLSDADDGLAVGDWVVCGDDGHGSQWINRLLPRSSLIVRGREEGGRQRIVANVDIALLVMGLDGDYSANRMERYLMLVRASGVRPAVLLTKPDRCEDLPSRLAEIRECAGDVALLLALDPRQPSTVEALAPLLAPGLTLVMLGSSGAGKSTLMNTLLGNTQQLTGATREGDDKGRHTTTARTLRPLPQGACLIDTPGVRELRLSGDETVASDAFEDIQALAAKCRFSNCRHESEPGCQVIGQVAPARLENFRKLQDEIAATRRTQLEAQDRKRHEKQQSRTLKRYIRDHDKRR
jgi:ribosome biogenesis GTPase